METKQKPATQLPKRVRVVVACGGFDVYEDDGYGNGDALDCTPFDLGPLYADAMTKRLNAYPKLVAAVSNLLAITNSEARSADLARTLLRELGESL